MKRGTLEFGEQSTPSSSTKFDTPTLAKKARKSGISFRTAQRWVNRGAFDISGLNKGLFGASEDIDSSDADSVSRESSPSEYQTRGIQGQSTLPLGDFDGAKCDSDTSCDSSDSNSSVSDTSDTSEETDNLDETCSDTLLGLIDSSFDSDDEIETCIYDGNQEAVVTKLHNYSDITVEETVFSLMSSYLNHNKTKSCLADDLKLYLSALPKPNCLPKSVYRLIQYVVGYAPSSPIFEHFCCETCQLYFGTTADNNCSACGETGSITFCVLSIELQIRYLFERQNLSSILMKANESRNVDINVITDITDSSEYKRVNSNRNPFDLTIILSTDGASIKRGAKADLWPVTFTLAEVPFSLRHLFITCAAVWYAQKKPDMNTFLVPVCKELKKLGKTGIKWIDPQTGVENTSKISAPLLIGDAPARAETLNTQHHNGKCGCPTCEIKTKKISRVEEGERRRRVYKVIEQEPVLRTKERMLVFGKVAEEKEIIIKGVKGRTVLSLLPGVDESTVVFAEFMHAVCLGVSKQVLSCWINKSNDFSLKEFVPELDKLIIAIKAPSYFSRPRPRPVSESHYWKAYEHLYWTLFYSVLILLGLREKFKFHDKVQQFERYFQHWLLYVISMTILMQEKIKINDLNSADRLLKLFVCQFEDLYGEKELTYNLHQLLHLCLNTNRWGPMYCTSAFPFEDFIGLLGKSVHGHGNVAKEIANKIKITEGVQSLGAVVRMRGIAKETKNVDNKCLGKARKIVLDEDVKNLLNANGIFSGFQVFSRARISRNVYTSKIHPEIQTIDFCVRYKCTDSPTAIGVIEVFIQHQNNIYLVLRPFSVDQEKLISQRESRTVLNSFIPIKHEKCELVLIPVRNVVQIVKLLLHGDFVCLIPKALTTKSVIM